MDGWGWDEKGPSSYYLADNYLMGEGFHLTFKEDGTLRIRKDISKLLL